MGACSLKAAAQTPEKLSESTVATSAKLGRPSDAASVAKSTIAVWLDSNGRARRVQILKSCGTRNCDAAAMAVAQAWSFAPSKGEEVSNTPRTLVIGVEVVEQ